MNILHVSAVKTWGGGENQIENLCFEIKTSNNEINQFILCVKNSEFHERLKTRGYNFIVAPLKIKMDVRFAVKIISICKLEKIDLIHIHDPTALTMCVLADRISGKLPPLIYNKKTAFPIKKRKQTLYKYNYKKIKKVVCVSKAVEKVSSDGILDKEKLITIHDGVRFDKMSTIAPFSLKDKFNISEKKVLIGHIGNHIRAKNLLTFIDVINEIVNVKKISDLHFIQIGSFTDRTPMYLEKVKKLNLEEHVTFTGFINNASSFLSQFTIFLFTSQSEGLGQVLIEALYFKVPVVATNAGGIPEIVINNKNGLLANVGDHEKLAENLIKIYNNKELINEFDENLLHSFSSKTMAKKMLEVYKSIIVKE